MRVLAIDYGRRRIGLALSDPTGLLARPWKTVDGAGNPAQVASRLAAEIASLTADADGLAEVVIGLPRRLNGEATAMSDVVTRVAERLRRLVPVPVRFQDERLTSREAEALLAEREPDWRRRKTMVDAMAAALILQDYLDARPATGVTPAADADRGGAA